MDKTRRSYPMLKTSYGLSNEAFSRIAQDLDKDADWQNVKNWGKGQLNKVKDWGAQNWQNLENTVTDQVTEFSNQLQQVPGQVQEALTPDWWSNIWNYQDPNALPEPDEGYLEQVQVPPAPAWPEAWGEPSGGPTEAPNEYNYDVLDEYLYAS